MGGILSVQEARGHTAGLKRDCCSPFLNPLEEKGVVYDGSHLSSHPASYLFIPLALTPDFSDL